MYAGLPNFAEEQWVAARKNILDGVAAEAARMADEMTLPGGGDANADNMEIDSSTKRRVIAQKDRLQRLVKMAGPKDARSDSMTVNILSLKERHQEMDLMRQTELHDWTKFTMPIL